ncbi:hypothetical protein CALVIDRAFT_538222 [Calocera viscosa TUFC12733]|uniref:Uncharacterized protein n=1 Tax=Calocera viscosa (strain TUFC12733) TaxID=1330018 RepID=A0A167L981_CALVF|nr:hypothetical protein CALVIDRAFT_538222 [Calocera viscosa TUFC12733]
MDADRGSRASRRYRAEPSDWSTRNVNQNVFEGRRLGAAARRQAALAEANQRGYTSSPMPIPPDITSDAGDDWRAPARAPRRQPASGEAPAQKSTAAQPTLMTPGQEFYVPMMGFRLSPYFGDPSSVQQRVEPLPTAQTPAALPVHSVLPPSTPSIVHPAAPQTAATAQTSGHPQSTSAVPQQATAPPPATDPRTIHTVHFTPQSYVWETVTPHQYICRTCGRPWTAEHRCGALEKPWETPVALRPMPLTPPATPPYTVAVALVPSLPAVTVAPAAPIWMPPSPPLSRSSVAVQKPVEDAWRSALEDLRTAMRDYGGDQPIYGLDQALESTWYVMQVADLERVREALKVFRELVDYSVKVLDPKWLTPSVLCPSGSAQSHYLLEWRTWAISFNGWGSHFNYYGTQYYDWLDYRVSELWAVVQFCNDEFARYAQPHAPSHTSPPRTSPYAYHPTQVPTYAVHPRETVWWPKPKSKPRRRKSFACVRKAAACFHDKYGRWTDRLDGRRRWDDDPDGKPIGHEDEDDDRDEVGVNHDESSPNWDYDDYVWR